MSTTAALLSAIAQAKQNLVENLEAKNVPAYGLTSFTQLAERVLEIPSSLPACPVEEENIPIPQGATYSASLEQLVQARESLRQNLGAKGIDVTGIQALSTLVEKVLEIRSGSVHEVSVPMVHVDWTATEGLDEFTNTPYHSYWNINDSYFEIPVSDGTEPGSRCTLWGPVSTKIYAAEGEYLYLFPGRYQLTVRIQLPNDVLGLSHEMTVTLYDDAGGPAVSQSIQDTPMNVGEIYPLLFEDLTVDWEGRYRLYLEGGSLGEEQLDLNHALNLYEIELDRIDESTTVYANTAALSAAVHEAAQYNSASNYVDFTVFAAARAEGIALLAARPKADAQSMVDAAAQALLNAIAGLILAADTTALKAALNEVKKYTPEDAVDFSAVTAAQTAGQALLDSKPSIDQQAEVDAAAQAIRNAIAALVWKSGTKRNPIAFKYASSVTKGLYYSYNGNVYLCKDNMNPCLILPGTSSAKREKVSV